MMEFLGYAVSGILLAPAVLLVIMLSSGFLFGLSERRERKKKEKGSRHAS